jgi:hypothetical protein
MTIKLPSIPDVSFRYSDQQAEAIAKALPCHLSPSDRACVLGAMEDVASVYKFLVTMERTSAGARSRREVEGLIKSVTDALTHLSAVNATWGPWFEEEKGLNTNNVMRGLLQLREAARILLSLHQVPATVRKSRKEKIARRMLVENAYGLWIATGDPAEVPKKVPSQMLDFIWEAVTPILVHGDQFGSGPSGRDALGKVVDVIRRDGVKLPFAFKDHPEEIQQAN